MLVDAKENLLNRIDAKVNLRFLGIAAGRGAYSTIGPQSIPEATSRFQILSSRSAGL